MLKRINLEDVRMGMFIEKLEGSWLKHPFWRTRFVLDDPTRLDELMQSDIPGVIIDTDKGLDQAAPRTVRKTDSSASAAGHYSPEHARPAAASQPTFAPPAPFTFHSPARAAMRREFGTAKRVAERSEKSLSRLFLDSRLGKVLKSETVAPIIDEIFGTLQHNPHAFNGLMRCKEGAPSVFRHAVTGAALMISLAMRMKLEPRQIRNAGTAGLLMDIGLAHIAEDEPAVTCINALSAEAEARHMVLSHDVLAAAGDMPEEVLQASLNHHERLDGSGFPAGLTGDSIGQFARIAAICDTFDHLVSPDEDGKASDPADALRVLVESPDKFDAAIVNAFVESMGIYPIGSIVELASGRLAMVVFADADMGDLPTVRTFYSLHTHKRLGGENIDLRHCFGRDRITGTATIDGLDLPAIGALRETLLTAALKDEL